MNPRGFLPGILLLAVLAAGCESDAKPRRPEPSEATTVGEADEPAEPVRPAPAAGRPSFADMVETARPAVVNIFTRTRVKTNRYILTPGRKLVPEKRVTESLGSGFVIDDEGHVLTNYHVVGEAQDIEVRLFDGRRFRAEVLGEDPKTDIALLRLDEASDMPVIPLGDSSELRVGDWVVAIGNPLGLTSTVTAGIVSATGRKSLPIGGMRYQDFIQTDASINPGNSGGALLDVDGNVVGINTAINEAGQGIGFAIPINMVKEILDRLKSGGRIQRSWLGIYVDPIPGPLRAELDLPDEGGALVKRVVKGGPAEKARLAPGDVILELDGEAIEDADQLAWLAGNIGVGKKVSLTIRRGNQELELPLVLGALPD